jgi:opacity protein-like surface antigen
LLKPWILAGICSVSLIGFACPSRAEILSLPSEVKELNLDKMPRAEEPESLYDFFRSRTKIGVGFDEEYRDNLLLNDNLKREEYISTVEALVFFADPRGSILYGLREEANAFRYHRSDNNAIDHDFLVFFDLDAGGRAQFRTEYLLETNHSLLFGPERDPTDPLRRDILRRSSDFQETVETAWSSRFRYALNEVNTFVPQLSYARLDDKTEEDTNTDRDTLKLNVDMDHDLTDAWVLFGGYAFKNVSLPKNELRNSKSNGGRIGLRHPLSETENLEVIFTGQQTAFEDGADNVDFGFEGTWKHLWGPRTQMELTYTDSQGTSYTAQRRRFRGRGLSLDVEYELTPLISLTGSTGYSLQTSGSADAIGSATNVHSEEHKSFTLGAGLGWQLGEQTKLTAGYSRNRSYSRDTTDNRVTLGVEIAF